MDVNFRIAKKEDIPGIIDLCNECFDEVTTTQFATQIFEETKLDKNNIYIIGLMDGKIIAHAKITIIYTIFDSMDCFAILNHVCVKEEYRRNNIATKLLDEITRVCKENGVKKMELWSKNYRVAAHSCYKKYGFILEEAGFFSKEV